MYHPTTRVLAVLELLQAHGRLGGADLSRRLGVDARTLRRYIARLEDIGVPITAERGRYGGYALAAGFKLPPMMFTGEEALALSLGLLAARSLGLDAAQPAVASAHAKLERVMPAPLKRRMRAIDETVALDLSKAPAGNDHVALAALSGAAQARQRVRLHYRAANGDDSERDFDAYGLGYRGGRWYVVGHCHLRRGLRSFRLDRVRDVRPLPASFGRPDGFDTLAHLAQSIATLPRAHAIEVLLHADLATARGALFEGIGLFEPVRGGVLLHAQADDLDWFARELMRLPFRFEARQPVALRTALAARAKWLLAANAGPGRAPSKRV